MSYNERALRLGVAGELPVSVMEEVRESLECETFNGANPDGAPSILTIVVVFVGMFASA